MPRYPHPVLISTPGSPTTDPVSGNQTPTPATPASGMAWLAQKPVAVIGSGTELAAAQDTVIASATMLTPPDAVLSEKSVVEDVDGAINGKPGSLWRVTGTPATRTGRSGSFRAASLIYISDQQ